MNKPNIVFIQVDQLSASFLRAYGDKVCRSPNLDHLASTGVVFETAYCNFPLCAPSRFSMATGQLCSRIGAYDNAAEMPASIPTYAHYLSSAGYQTALSGKMHFVGPDQYHGFEKRLTADLYPADFSWAPNWPDEGKRDTNDTRGILTSGICERSVQIDFDEAVTFNAIQHLYNIARSRDRRPFFLQVSYTHPHEPYLCGKEFWDLYDNIDIPLPTTGALPVSKHDAHSVRLLSSFQLLNFSFTDEEIRQARRAYYGSISYIDGMIGQVLNTLRAIGADETTAIVFTSDHGEMLGERGMWFKKHFFEPSLRIPLIVSAPWLGAGRSRELVSLVDILPTFMGLAEGSGWRSPIEELDGMDLTTLFDSGKNRPTRAVFAEYLAESTPAPIVMIRRGQFKYIHSFSDPALLFDIENDPSELVNLVGRPELEDVVKSFEREVHQRWDGEQLHKEIELSQRRRNFIRKCQTGRQPTRWNHDEAPGEEVLWYRGQGGYNEWAFAYLPHRAENVS